MEELESHLDGKRCRSPAEKEINGNWERKGNTQSAFLDNGDLQAVIESHVSPLSSHSTTNEEVNWFLFKYAFGKEKKLRILMTFTWHPEDPHVPLQKPEDQIITRNDLCTRFSHSLNYWAPTVLCGYPSYLRNEEQDATVKALKDREGKEEAGTQAVSYNNAKWNKRHTHRQAFLGGSEKGPLPSPYEAAGLSVGYFLLSCCERIPDTKKEHQIYQPSQVAIQFCNKTFQM